ncbi:MAG: sirohydrochlorin cobaltochelatase [Oscillospiraceae bacterium]
MSKKGILAASFGTSFDETREKNIGALENELAQTFKDYKLYSAFTSGMVRKLLAQKGIETFDAKQMLKKMQEDGVTQVIVQPTHLLYGDEFDKLCMQAIESEYLFKDLKISTPLLADTQDMRKVLHILNDNVKTQQGEALVLMGHGTQHFCNSVYGALDYMAKAEGMEHIFVGTVEGYPDFDLMLKQIQRAGYKKVVITPLMLVAGDHATNDMASEEKTSWKSQFEAVGIKARCVVKGLGEYPEIRKIYCTHTMDTIGEK